MDEWTARTREASALPGGRAGLHSRETTRNGQRGPARPYCMYLAWTTNRSWYGSCRQKEERQKSQGTLVPHTGILWSLSQVTWFAAPPCAFPLENMSMGESQPRASRFQQVPPRVRYVLSLPVFYLSTSPLPLPPPSTPVFPPGNSSLGGTYYLSQGVGRGGVYHLAGGRGWTFIFLHCALFGENGRIQWSIDAIFEQGLEQLDPME